MPDSQSPDTPAPEVLKPEDETGTPEPEAAQAAPTAATGDKTKPAARPRHVTYRPSHKATFIGLGVVVLVLAINAAVVIFLMRGNEEAQEVQRNQVTISTEELEKLGVNQSDAGDLGTELIVGPNSRFNGEVEVGGDVNIAGQLTLNNKVTAADASLTKLQAGETAIEQLNVNADGTMTNLSLRSNLSVAGITQMQGAVSVNNNMNIIGNLTVGGALFAGSFQASNLVSGSTLTIGGHIVVKGSSPSVTAGPAVGSSGTVSVSGTDTSGTVAVNIGSGASSGIVANVTFTDDYESTPHVVITAVGRSAGSIYVNRTANGFSIGVGAGLSPGGYAFDYIVMQ